MLIDDFPLDKMAAGDQRHSAEVINLKRQCEYYN